VIVDYYRDHRIDVNAVSACGREVRTLLTRAMDLLNP
jgi:hypothetical protein